MTLKSRIELEAHFKSGRRPSQEHFAELIRSTLNKRDDQFLGRWREGTTYRSGDIVVYERALWELGTDEDGDDFELCSHEPPAPESEDWQSLVIPIEDEDWFLVDVVTEVPAEGEGGELEEGELEEGALSDDRPIPATMHAHPRVVRVAVGTDAPQGFLDLLESGRGRWLFNPGEGPEVATYLMRPCEDEAWGYLAHRLAARAEWVTDAPGGFALLAGEELCEGEEPAPERALVVVQRDGRVGIGTEEPNTKLEVTNGLSGRFLFNLDRRVNPCLGIVNLRPGCRENYLTAGVDNDVAVFVTDSDFGFVFRAGGESGIDEHEIDINQGETLAALVPEGRGKLGVGKQPESFQLDVHGLARAHGFFVDTDRCNLDRVRPLFDVLERVARLRPVAFNWDAATELDGEKRQIGLVAHEVDDVFPEAVETNRDMTKSVAHHALVPVLIKAVQEQQAQLEELRCRLADAENRLQALEDCSND